MDDRQLTGATLLFAGQLGERYEALLYSYVFDCTSLAEVTAAAKKLKPEVDSWQSDENISWQFLGIEDLFCVVGPLSEGAMLGRTTLWELDEPEDAIDLVAETGEKIERLNPRGANEPEWAIAEAVYFVSEDSSEEAFTIVANILLDWKEGDDVDLKALEICSSEATTKRVCSCGSEIVGDVKFVGVQAIRHVPEDIAAGGALEKRSRVFDSFEEISELIEADEELQSFDFPVPASNPIPTR